MISRLSGTLLEVDPPYLLIDVHGVGYEVEVPTSLLAELPPAGQPLVLRTHLQTTQDNQTLYGFSSTAERAVFRRLLRISGIGAKLALNILSGAPGSELARYVADGDSAALTRLPGIGKKTAERIIIELRDQLDDLPAATPGAGGAAGDAVREATDALRALGYKPAEVSRMVRNASEPDMSAEDIIRKALREAAA
ncbi:MAG: Holliday junction branch migration protein RuvA [Gammaproteobacteria bacterium]